MHEVNPRGPGNGASLCSVIGVYTRPLPTDKDDPAFNFYTNLSGTTKVVCDFKFLLPIGARFEGGLPDFRAESKEIESVRPGFVIWRVRDGTVALFSDRFQFAGDGDSSNGQQWF